MNAAVSGSTAPPSAARAPRAKFLKKITPKTVTDETGVKLSDREWVTLNLKGQLTLYDLFGVVNKTKTGHTDKGEWTAFVGRFRAVAPTGEMFDSGKAHIPVLEPIIYSALMEAQEVDPKASAHIAVRIGVKPAPKDKPSATGYEYWAERLVEAQAEDDPIARLMSQAAGQSLLSGPGSGPAAGNPVGGTPAAAPAAAPAATDGPAAATSAPSTADPAASGSLASGKPHGHKGK